MPNDSRQTRAHPTRPPAADLPSLGLGGAAASPGSAGIVRWLRAAIEQRRVQPGTRLPSTRDLAQQLRIARGTVASAFDQLTAEGYLVGRHGSGTFVSDEVPFGGTPAPVASAGEPVLEPSPLPDVDPPAPPGLIDFSACRPSTAFLPLAAWRRAWADAASHAPSGDYGDGLGEEILRRGIAGYVARARGLLVPAESIVVTAGAVQAINLLARALLAPGDVVAVEDPGYPLARQAYEGAGARILPIPVDDDGMQVNLLPEADAVPRLIHVTPSHQFPLGSRLSLQRRLQLLEWAERHAATVVEDDYDGEFRFDTPPLPPLASLPGADRVAYLGTFSKNLMPSLRLGYAITAPSLIEVLRRRKVMLDYHTPTIPQQAVGRFIADGHFERHVLRMRRRYAERREALTEAVRATGLPGRLVGLEAGLHACLEAERQPDAAAVARRAAGDGIWLHPVSRYAIGAISQHGLVLGYAALEPPAIREGVERLAGALNGVSRVQHRRLRRGTSP